MFGLGKPRSNLGKWIDEHGVSQIKLSGESGVSRKTIERLCKSEGTEKPNRDTALKITKALKKLTGCEVSIGDFWD